MFWAPGLEWWWCHTAIFSTVHHMSWLLIVLVHWSKGHPLRASPEAFWGSRRCALPPGQHSGEEHCRKLSHICEQAFTKPCNGQFRTVHINPKIFLSFLWIEGWTTFYSATKHTSESLVSTSSIHVHLKVFKSWWPTVAGFLFPIAITEGGYGNTQGNTSSLLFVDDLSLNAGYTLCCFG